MLLSSSNTMSFPVLELGRPMRMRWDNAQLFQLFFLNVALQIFDGVATYEGIHVGWKEANPLLVSAFAYLGVGPTLLLFKAKACFLLVMLHRNDHHRLVPPVLLFLACAYSAFSLLPWLAKFAGLLLH